MRAGAISPETRVEAEGEEEGVGAGEGRAEARPHARAPQRGANPGRACRAAGDVAETELWFPRSLVVSARGSVC